MLNSAPLNSGPLNALGGAAPAPEPAPPVEIGPFGPVDPANPAPPPGEGTPGGHVWAVTVGSHTAELTDLVTVQHPDTGNAVAGFSYFAPGQLPGVGTPVAIAFNGHLLHTGKVEQTSYDSLRGVVTVRSSTDLRAAIMAMTKQQIELLIGGHWSEDVFGPLEERDNWQYAQERLSTRPVGLGVDREGNPRVVPLLLGTGKHFAFTAGSTFDGTATGSKITPAEQAPGAVVEIDYRYSHRLQFSQSYTWTSVSGRGTSGFEQYHYNRSHQLPDKPMLESAIASTGWRLGTLQTTKLPPSNPAIRWFNRLSLDVLLSADFSLRTRWVQRRVERYRIELGDTSGETNNFKTVIDVPAEEDAAGWADWAGGSVGFDRDQARFDRAAAVLLAQAGAALGEAQGVARYSWQAPLAHCLDIDGGDFASIADQGVTGAGVAMMVADEISIESGSAVRTLTVEERSAAAVLMPPMPLPAAEFPEWPTSGGLITLPNQMADLGTDPETFDPELPGFAGNYTFTTITPGGSDPEDPEAPPDPYIANGVFSAYPRRFAIPTPEVPENMRNEVIAEVTL